MMIRSFIVLILFFSVFKSLAIFLTTYNLFGDEAQYWLWSKELSFGYLSKPPLIAWVIYLYPSIFGESFQALKHLISSGVMTCCFENHSCVKDWNTMQNRVYETAKWDHIEIFLKNII